MAFEKDILEKNLQEVANHYITAKKHLLFAENYSQKIYLGAVNEFRNAFDHLIRAIVKEDTNEFEKARSHLRRAAYDSCEVVTIDLIKTIHNKVDKFDSEVITAILPEYYKTMYQRLLEIQKEISIERGENDDLFKENDHLSNYVSLMEELITIDTIITSAIVGMEEYKRKIKREKRSQSKKNIVINIIVGILSAIIASFMLLLLK